MIDTEHGQTEQMVILDIQEHIWNAIEDAIRKHPDIFEEIPSAFRLDISQDGLENMVFHVKRRIARERSA